MESSNVGVRESSSFQIPSGMRKVVRAVIFGNILRAKLEGSKTESAEIWLRAERIAAGT